MFDTILMMVNEQRAIIHLLLHALVPLLVAYYFAPQDKWKWVLLVLLATMVVDVDHLLANPIYAPNRCSIWFHPLHTLWPMVVYGLMALWPLLLTVMKRQINTGSWVMGLVGLGLVIHMVLDWLDCLWMQAL